MQKHIQAEPSEAIQGGRTGNRTGRHSVAAFMSFLCFGGGEDGGADNCALALLIDASRPQREQNGATTINHRIYISNQCMGHNNSGGLERRGEVGLENRGTGEESRSERERGGAEGLENS